jgi:MFS family permease
MSQTGAPSTVAELTPAGRYVILVCAFLGWFFCGFHMANTSLAMRPAAIDLLARNGELDKAEYGRLSQAEKQGLPLTSEERARFKEWNGGVGSWFSWLSSSFLFGGAAGGFVFGKLGDRIGRSKSMAFCILTYSLLSGAAASAQSPLQLAIVWFLASMGFGGMWPNGVALVSEAWSSMSRSFTAGAIGTAANIGIFLFSTFIGYVQANRVAWSWLISADGWSWMFLLGSIPAVLGVVSLFIVPESPRWLASQLRHDSPSSASSAPTTESIFRPPLLSVTLIGITLATVPMIGGWGSANFMVPWAEQDGVTTEGVRVTTSAAVSQARSLTGLVGSLLGGWIGCTLGRRLTYFLVSIATLGFAQWTFWYLTPIDPLFLYGVAGLGFFSGIYFGWMPLCLPELYPTRVRSTGAGVCFNFGRILTAATVFGAGALMTYFEGRYDRIGRLTSLFFAVGLIAIWFAPDTSTKKLDD